VVVMVRGLVSVKTRIYFEDKTRKKKSLWLGCGWGKNLLIA
jgi:hypothetical protein